MTLRETKTERARLEQVAKGYRAEGYEVSIQPSSPDLPLFLRDLGVDMLATRGSQTVVIQVKSRISPKQDRNLARISELIEQHPEFRFDLVALAGADKPDDATSIDTRYLCQRLDEAATLLTSGFNHAALLLTWSAAEGALRFIAEREKIAVGKQSPLLMLKTIFSRGLLNKRDYDLLERTVRQRNTAVHGFKVDQVDTATLRSAGELAKSLLECGSQEPGS